MDSSTPSDLQVDLSDNASDGFDYFVGADGDGYAEIGSAAGRSEDGEVVAEYFVEGGKLVDSASEILEGAPKRLKVEKHVMTAQEIKSSVEAKIAGRVNQLWEATSFPDRVSIPRDVKVTIDEATHCAKGFARCLLCGVWFSVQLNDYTYKVHNYKRHLTKFHVNTGRTASTIPCNNRGRGGAKRALTKASNNAQQKSVSSFFNHSQESGASSSQVKLLHEEELEYGSQYLDSASGEFFSVSQYAVGLSDEVCEQEVMQQEKQPDGSQDGQLSELDALIEDLSGSASTSHDGT